MTYKSSPYLLIILLFTICLSTGCSSDKPIVSKAAKGNGYKITLASTNKELESGGSLILTATIFDSENNLIADEKDAVYFVCNVADVEFNKNSYDIKKGVATAILSWEDDSRDDSQEPPKMGVITASYGGAIAQLSILLVTENF